MMNASRERVPGPRKTASVRPIRTLRALNCGRVRGVENAPVENDADLEDRDPDYLCASGIVKVGQLAVVLKAVPLRAVLFMRDFGALGPVGCMRTGVVPVRICKGVCK